MKKLLTLLIFVLTTVYSYAAVNPDDIAGVWVNSSNKAHIEIFKQNDKYFGKIVWLKKPNDANGKPKVDRKNPDVTKRTQSIIGLVVLRDFKFKDNEWRNGKIYNPQDGKEYKSVIKFKDTKSLSVRGYIGFSFIGKTEVFTRVKE